MTIPFSKRLAGTALALVLSLGSPGKAETIYLEDFNYVLHGLPAGASSYVSVRWGLWNGTNFTEPTDGTKSGYASLAGNDIGVSLNQVSGSTYTPLPANTSLALALFSAGNSGVTGAQASSLIYSVPNAVYQTILTDAAWQIPVGGFNNNATLVRFSFSANTTAQVGSYNFNSGVENITMVPEPSTASMFLLGAVGWAALRRLRKI